MKIQIWILSIFLLNVTLFVLPPLSANGQTGPCAGVYCDFSNRNWSPSTNGNVVGITVVLNFSELDTIYPIDMADIGAFLNQEGYTGHGNNGSVQDYFVDVSCGELSYSNYLHPVPYLAPFLREDFQNEPLEAADALAADIILWLDEDQELDFSNYDANGDGFIDAINIFAQGSGVTQMRALHPHVGEVSVSVDGVNTIAYMIDNIGNFPQLGDFCHENAHMLFDWGDYYNGAADPLGNLGQYCLMGKTTANPLTNPVHPNAYLKKLAGWSNPATLGSGQMVQADYGVCDASMILNPEPNSDELYIIENRNNIGRDSGLQDSGLAIFHVEQVGLNYLRPDIDLLQADGDGDALDSGNLWAAPGQVTFDFPVPVWSPDIHAGFYFQNISEPGITMSYQYGSYDMVQVSISAEPNGAPFSWILSDSSSFELNGEGEYDTVLPGIGPFTVSFFGNPFNGSPNPPSVTIDLSASPGPSEIFSSQFDSPFSVHGGGDLGDPSSATTACAVDFNSDGFEDLFIANNHGSNLILLANGNGGFFENSAPTILAQTQGIKQAAWGDIDNDGDKDVFVVCDDGNHMLLQNSSSDLVDITPSSGLSGLGELSSVAWNDIDRDGNLDCFIVHRNSNNKLYIGDGNGNFAPGDPGEAGNYSTNTDYSYWCDFNGSGFASVLVSREENQSRFFKNTNGVLSGLYAFWSEYAPSVMCWGDFNKDNQMDLIRILGPTKEIEVWTQQTDNIFSQTIIGHLPMTCDETSINLVDFNNDGFPDIYVTNANGHDFLFMNRSDDFGVLDLTEIPLSDISETAGNSIASVAIDANYDGAMDLYVACGDGPNFLLLNGFEERGNWIGFDLASVSQNSGAVSSRVLLVNNSSLIQSGEVLGGCGPIQNSQVLYFGLGDLTSIESALVMWGPGSIPTPLINPAINHVHRLTEPQGTPPPPIISDVAEFPVLAGGTNNSIFAVHIENNGSTSMAVTADLGLIGGQDGSLLQDDGVEPDLTAGDWVFTSAAFSSDVAAGQYSVDVEAQGTLIPYANQSVSVEVIESTLLLKDGSSDTGDLTLLTGEPYAAIYFDTPVGSSDENVMVVAKDSNEAPEVFRKEFVLNGAPYMQNVTDDWFSFDEKPIAGSRGTYAADFDNDGDEDLFVCNNESGTRLYRNTGTGFSDETTALFGIYDYALPGAHVAAWGDYNQDSKLDLFVATMDYTGSIEALASNPGLASNPVWHLFENKGDSFELTYLHMPASLSGLALSASWNDVNADGLLDLVVGEFNSTVGDGPTVLINEGYKKTSGHYVLTEDPTMTQVAGLNVNSLDWIDYNHDDLPDLVVTEFFPNTGAKILENTATGFDVAVVLESDRTWTGAIVPDLNQDGQDDVVLLPEAGMPEMHIGDPADESSYTELAYPLGVRDGSASGGLAADFNSDGDVDLYLGRENTDEFLYKNRRVDDEENPTVGQQNWISFTLETEGNCNSSLIGTRVTVSDGSSQWQQTVDGGSGRGGQRSNELHFGVGSSNGPFDVTVDWPVSSQEVFTGLTVNTDHTLTDDAVPTINQPSIQFSHEPYPGGADWVFSWSTNERGSEELDEVDLDFGTYLPGDYCYQGPNLTLGWGDPDVEITIVPGNLGTWNHTLVWSGQLCLGEEICNFQFKARSSVGVQTPQESSWVDFGEFDVCVSKKDIQY